MIKEYKKSKFILIPFIIIGYIIIIKYLDKISANILLITFLSIYINTYILPDSISNVINKYMHTKIIKLPNIIKCLVRINKKDYYCYNDSSINNIQSQQNSDIDFYTLGHFIMWYLIGYYSTKKVSYKKVIIISLFWETLEAFGNKFNVSTNARLTDIFINIIGFHIGRKFKKFKNNI